MNIISLGRIVCMVRGRTRSMEAKKALQDSITLPTGTYASETWMWSKSQRSRIQGVEMSYLRAACDTSRTDG